MKMFNPPHPGPVIKRILEDVPVTVPNFAFQLGADEAHLRSILEGEASVTPELSLQISEALGQGRSAVWFRVQQQHDEWVGQQADHPESRAPFR